MSPIRMSTLLAPTLREAPADAEAVGHRLMLRAGLMRKLAGGIYGYLPLGLRAIAKVAAIAREELDRAGGQEVLLPAVQPHELWEESGRGAVYGDELWRLKDRHGRMFALAPGAEVAATDLIRHEVSSWRQLPLLIYQVTNKYRDEPRPRFGAVRAREFVTADAYSCDRDREGLAAARAGMKAAFAAYCTRCGLDWREVEADPGAAGDGDAVEFVALAGTGEVGMVHCAACGYAARIEQAEGVPTPAAPVESPAFAGSEPVRLHTPGVRTIDQLCAFAGLPRSRTAKILFYRAEFGGEEPGALVAALVRGDHQLNETKLRKAVGAVRLRMAEQAEVVACTGAPFGSAGPVGLRGGVRLLSDRAVAGGQGFAVGANEEDWHLLGAKAERDFDPGQVADLRLAGGGDPCPRCGAALVAARGIEVGHMFALGTEYRRTMGATYLDERGEAQLIEMGCYGIGITRTVAAIVERHHDADGIVWPFGVAPFHVSVVPVTAGEGATAAAAEELYRELVRAGVETVLDDRDERPGIKFKDADLLGFPLRATVGRALRDGKIELRRRAGGETELIDLRGAAAAIRERVAAGLSGGTGKI